VRQFFPVRLQLLLLPIFFASSHELIFSVFRQLSFFDSRLPSAILVLALI